jgi:hypothetical protein
MKHGSAVVKMAVLSAAALAAACGQAEPSVVAIPFTVTINPGVVRPAGSTIGIVGNQLSLGATAGKPEGDATKALKLRQTADGKWVGAAWLPPGPNVKYAVHMLSPVAAEQKLDGSPEVRTVDFTRADESVTVVAFAVPTDIIRPCITFKLTVPANTPGTDAIYIAGNDDQLGPWNPAKTALDKNADGTYGKQLCFDQGKALEYKYVRNGDWAYVEKTSAGAERANRTLTITDAIVQSDTVDKWADL